MAGVTPFLERGPKSAIEVPPGIDWRSWPAWRTELGNGGRRCVRVGDSGFYPAQIRRRARRSHARAELRPPGACEASCGDRDIPS